MKGKKFAAVLLAAALGCPLMAPVGTGAETVMLGDADSNGQVNAADATRILIEASILGTGGESIMTESEQLAADVTMDGVRNAVDSMEILNYCVMVGSGDFDGTLAAYLNYEEPSLPEETEPATPEETEPATPEETEPATPEETEPVTDPPVSEEELLRQMADEAVVIVNQERAKEGLSPLKAVPKLNEIAVMRSDELAEKFSHTRPDGSDCWTAVDNAKVPYRSYGENIAYGADSAEEVMDLWMHSEGHRANILSSDFDYIGIGVYKEGYTYYWTQIFTGGETLSDAYLP